jgi:aminoglycoside 3-N-acetyltransferase
MSELDVIKETPFPRTQASLAHDLRLLGVLSGMTLIVHSSLRSLGWVCGGPESRSCFRSDRVLILL